MLKKMFYNLFPSYILESFDVEYELQSSSRDTMVRKRIPCIAKKLQMNPSFFMMIDNGWNGENENIR